MMGHTAFPATPDDVAVLTTQEFTVDLDELGESDVSSIAHVCRRFGDDANRELVWWIRFAALKAWCTRTDVMTRLIAHAWIWRDACEAAASFPLNDRWEFDPEDFGSAIEAVRRVRSTQATVAGRGIG